MKFRDEELKSFPPPSRPSNLTMRNRIQRLPLHLCRAHCHCGHRFPLEKARARPLTPSLYGLCPDPIRTRPRLPTVWMVVLHCWVWGCWAHSSSRSNSNSSSSNNNNKHQRRLLPVVPCPPSLIWWRRSGVPYCRFWPIITLCPHRWAEAETYRSYVYMYKIKEYIYFICQGGVHLSVYVVQAEFPLVLPYFLIDPRSAFSDNWKQSLFFLYYMTTVSSVYQFMPFVEPQTPMSPCSDLVCVCVCFFIWLGIHTYIPTCISFCMCVYFFN